MKTVSGNSGSDREEFPFRNDGEEPGPDSGIDPAVAVTETGKGIFRQPLPQEPVTLVGIHCSDKEDPYGKFVYRG